MLASNAPNHRRLCLDLSTIVSVIAAWCYVVQSPSHGLKVFYQYHSTDWQDQEKNYQQIKVFIDKHFDRLAEMIEQRGNQGKS